MSPSTTSASTLRPHLTPLFTWSGYQKEATRIQS
jgi:hypothetical protein